MDAGLPSSKLNEQPLAVDFIDNHAHEYHVAFANLPTRYDCKLGKYRQEPQDNKQETPTTPHEYGHSARPPPPALDKLRFWEQIFPLAMESFKAIRPKEPEGRPESGRSIRTLQSWNAVYMTLKDAQTANESSDGVRGMVKKGFHRVIKYSQPLEQVLSLVPDIDYVSPVTGTLEIVIKAAKRSIQVHDDIANGLDALEKHFGNIDTYLKIFSNDENIVIASVRLVSYILKAVEDIIGFFLRRSASKAISALFNGEEYQKALSESLEDITQSGQDLLSQAQSSDMWQTLQTLRTVQHNSSILGGMAEKQWHMAENQQEMADMQNALLSLLGQLSENLENARRERDEFEKRIEENTFRQAQQATYYHTYVFPTLQQRPPPGPSREDILNLLDTPAFHNDDVGHILDTRELIPSEDRVRSERVLTAREFRSWMIAPNSQELLIHGDFAGTRYISGLSWLCCSILQALQQTGRLYSLVFFCGRHLGAADPHVGGRGIIRSLLSQLLCQQPPHTTQDQAINWELIQAGDIQHLCLLFHSTLRQLPPESVVFCIIDGIKYYERDQYVDEMSEVLRFLLDLTQGGQVQYIFKILITSPSPTTMVRQAFSQDCIISMGSLPCNADKPSSLRTFRHLEESL
ncbi:hypothetical protein F4823DRAFT_602606 [Ustulina deusta]|nr:hypothetical protein F4823DRAFT_602606 [Ustulina deusta]